MAGKAGQRVLVALDVSQREVRCCERLIQPRSWPLRNALSWHPAAAARNADRAKLFGPSPIASFLDPHPLVHRHVGKRLGLPAWPGDRHLINALAVPQTEQQLLRVL